MTPDVTRIGLSFGPFNTWLDGAPVEKETITLPLGTPAANLVVTTTSLTSAPPPGEALGMAAYKKSINGTKQIH
jgi:hypothetical protein